MSASELIQKAQRVAIKIAEGVRLKAVRDNAVQEIMRQVRGRGAAEQPTPARPKAVEVEPLEACDLGFDRDAGEHRRRTQPGARHRPEASSRGCVRDQSRGEEIVEFHVLSDAWFAPNVQRKACYFNALSGERRLSGDAYWRQAH